MTAKTVIKPKAKVKFNCPFCQARPTSKHHLDCPEERLTIGNAMQKNDAIGQFCTGWSFGYQDADERSIKHLMSNRHFRLGRRMGEKARLCYIK